MKTLADKVLVFAYRGASAYAPENTIEAFDLAHKMGADAITLNVVLTADGEVVTSDTPLINSVSNGQGLILDYTLEELKIFDFGYQFYKGQRKGIKIPTLDEAYDFLATTNMLVNVELKSYDPRAESRSYDPNIVNKCIEVAKRHNMQERTLYSSADQYQLRRIKTLDPNAHVAPLVLSCDFSDPIQHCVHLQTNVIHPRHGQAPYNDGFVETCHKSGLRVHAWVANSEEKIAVALSHGVDGVITNRPDVAIRLRDGIQEEK
ncbi:MAG: glycerophosphodiester phosphodiesterase [Clostridia bacterium]|nr:glycerophosphodiester phosphodiesterase [Clostridia bacterium]